MRQISTTTSARHGKPLGEFASASRQEANEVVRVMEAISALRERSPR